MHTLREIAYRIGTGLLFAGACVVLLVAAALWAAEDAYDGNPDAPGWPF